MSRDLGDGRISPLPLSKYRALYPDVPAHMIEEGPSVLAVAFVTVAPNMTGCAYPGGYCKVTLVDIQAYPPGIREKGLAIHAARPFRVYVRDYDDGCWEAMFATCEEAVDVLNRLVESAPITAKALRDLGLLPA